MHDRLIFGVGKIHHLPFPWERQRILLEAVEIGFRAFDVAPAYGNGLNEIELGLAIRKRRSEIQVTTKFGIPLALYGARSRHFFHLLRAVDKFANPNYGKAYRDRLFSGQEMRRSLEGSLRRLKCDYVDRLLIHEPLVPIDMNCFEELTTTAASLKKTGMLKSFGIAGPLQSIESNLNCREIEVVQTLASDIDGIPIVEGRCRVAYGLYRYFRSIVGNQNSCESFEKFIGYELSRSNNTELILTTLSSARLNGFKKLFR